MTSSNEQLVRELEQRFGDRAIDGLWVNLPAKTFNTILAALRTPPAQQQESGDTYHAFRAGWFANVAACAPVSGTPTDCAEAFKEYEPPQPAEPLAFSPEFVAEMKERHEIIRNHRTPPAVEPDGPYNDTSDSAPMPKIGDRIRWRGETWVAVETPAAASVMTDDESSDTPAVEPDEGLVSRLAEAMADFDELDWLALPDKPDEACGNGMPEGCRDYWRRRAHFIVSQITPSIRAQALEEAWRPIETAPETKGQYFWCSLAFGPLDDLSYADGFRWNGKWFAAATFYKAARRFDECQYEFRQIEVQPHYWRPRSSALKGGQGV